MDNWQPSTLSWSFSRKTHFDDCRRHYFYHRFWGQDPKMRWKLFEMRNITTLTMMRGLVVHQVVAEALYARKLGAQMPLDQAKKRITALLRERFQESGKRLWHIDNRPQGRKASSITNLLEHYYNIPETNERARNEQKIAWACVENLMGSQLWSEIMSGDPGKWMEIEDESFPSFDIDGVQVYVRIDFAHKCAEPTIIDWKTGATTPEDRLQLAVYAMYAQEKWGWDALGTKLVMAHLHPELSVESAYPTQDELDAARELVKTSFAKMREVEPAFGPADISDFPLTDDTSHCRWCRFQGICEGAKRI